MSHQEYGHTSEASGGVPPVSACAPPLGCGRMPSWSVSNSEKCGWHPCSEQGVYELPRLTMSRCTLRSNLGAKVVPRPATATHRPWLSQQTAPVIFTLHFLPHSSCHLCYDERAHG